MYRASTGRKLIFRRIEAREAAEKEEEVLTADNADLRRWKRKKIWRV